MNIVIRNETKSDIQAISDITRAAFENCPYGDHTEQFIINALRDANGLGPISVLPELQRKGIGKSLLREGLSSLKSLGAKGCILVGDPGYYEQFGFRSNPELTIDGVPQENVLALTFGENKARGAVTFHEGFTATG
jgi:putative acetyltransferase